MTGINNLNKFEIISFLRENGYPIQHGGNYISFPAKWRDGDNLTSITGYLNEDLFIDWVTSERFNTKSLIQKVLNIKNNEVDNFLKEKNIFLSPKIEESVLNFKEKIKIQEVFDESILNDIIKNNDYWVGRGISNETANLFEGGVCNNGILKDRQVLVIRNSKNQIIGLTGRDLTDKKKIKWKICGAKTKFVYPAQLNTKVLLEKKSVILVESPADVLSLYSCGIQNVLCLFGIELHLGVLNFLLKIKPKKIIIAVNNDIDLNGGVGNQAALKIQNKIRKYFDYHVTEIRLPIKKDINDMLTFGMKEDIIKLYGQILK